MATPTITHRTVTHAPADAAALVDGPAWDDTHVITGLENVDNTSDVNKPVSSAQAAAIALKAPLAFTQVGTGASARTVDAKLKDGYISVKDFGAVGDGTTDDAASFQAAVNSVASGAAVTILIPASASSYKLSSSVTNNGRFVSWQVSAGATFSGAGDLPGLNTANYGGMSIKNVQAAYSRGSASVPDGTAGALQITQLYSNSTGTTTQNPAAAFMATKYTTAAGTRVQGLFSEAIDAVGWVGTGNVNFIEGIRAQSTLTAGTLGSAYGIVSAASEVVGVTHTYLVGNESEVDTNTTDATGTFNNNSFTASYLATSRGIKKVDAAYVVNPNTAAVAEYIRGFYVPGGASNTPVSESAFRTDAAATWGFYVGGATYGSLRIPNNIPIRAGNAAASTDLNVLTINPSDQLVLGAETTAGVVAANPLIYAPTALSTGPTLQVSSTIAATIANGANYSITGIGNSFVFALVVNRSTGNWGIYTGYAGLGLVLVTSSTEFVAPTTTPAAGKTSFAWNGTHPAIYNNQGASGSFNASFLVVN